MYFCLYSVWEDTRSIGIAIRFFRGAQNNSQLSALSLIYILFLPAIRTLSFGVHILYREKQKYSNT